MTHPYPWKLSGQYTLDRMRQSLVRARPILKLVLEVCAVWVSVLAILYLAYAVLVYLE
jgi:hypothetical protein